ncbi:MAG TPA: hypothetical protein VE954_21370 [Oligoflexus sp.]|uniref:hypothetical protein n=1 Tax=Oligoflexus sp. TaxID=1971216 RepID=UPI002D55D98A|nr:hypothetical protein [Oligoflexus sp.]HYX35656.1 hypothetical protein [Oligoflexus sp.]
MRSSFIKAVIPGFMLLTACAHHRDVRPSEDGLHSVQFQTEEKGQGFREGMSQANHYCEQFKQQAYQVNESSQYVGSMDESTYNTGKTVSKVAKVAGTAGYIFGGKNESKVGGAASVGGVVGDAVLGEGYQYQMRFKCK